MVKMVLHGTSVKNTNVKKWGNDRERESDNERDGNAAVNVAMSAAVNVSLEAVCAGAVVR
jgi:hypothetical protein